MLAGFLALVILVIRLFPSTALARSLHLWFVELPLEIARRVERKHLILLVILLCAGQTLALAGGAELAMAYAVDTSLYLDAMLATYAAAAAARLKSAACAFKAAVARVAARVPKSRPRSHKARPAPKRVSEADNDDDPISLPLACAA